MNITTELAAVKIATADEKLRQRWGGWPQSYPSLPFSGTLSDVMLANFECHPDKATGCLVNLLNITVGLSLRVFLDGITI